MPAVAIAINLDNARADAVRSYFAKFAVLPPRNLRIGSTRVVSGPASLENLMDAMLSFQGQKEFAVVTHGFSDGSGLFLQLVTRGQASAGVKVKHDAITTLMAIAARNPAKITADDGTKLEITEKEIDRLIGKMKKIQAIGITTIEFRGCNLGRNSNSVSEFRKFFGAASFGAPKLHSFFGSGPAKFGPQIVAVHARAHQGTTITYTMSFGGKNCHCCIGINLERKPENGHVVADDAGTLDQWIQANFSANATLGTEQSLSIHGLWLIPPIDPNDIFAKTPEPRPIFPLAKDPQGVNEYALNMLYSP